MKSEMDSIETVSVYGNAGIDRRVIGWHRGVGSIVVRGPRLRLSRYGCPTGREQYATDMTSYPSSGKYQV
jgi:hypothetical protein